MIKVHTAQGKKDCALNGPMFFPESFKKVGQSVIVDVNSTALDTDLFWEDQRTDVEQSQHYGQSWRNETLPGRENAILDS